MVAASDTTKQALRDLCEEYAICLNTMDLERWPSFFTEDGRYLVVSAENHELGLEHAAIFCDGLGMIRDRALAVRKTMVYQPRRQRRFLSNLRLHPTGDDEFRSEIDFLITEVLQDAEPAIIMVGRYVDTTIRQDGVLKFRERRCVYDNDRIGQSVIIPV